jgi:hypothetical protein
MTNSTASPPAAADRSPRTELEAPAEPAPGPALDAEALALLPLPDLDEGLTAEQIRGGSCVWCDTALNAETAVDFGERSGTLDDVTAPWYPRACRRCVLDAVLAEYKRHPRMCEQCVDDPAVCHSHRALRRLALEARR